MKFYDTVTITIQSGKGWDGSASGRREKYIAYGGPSGGDGGKGGSVYAVASPNEYTLMPFRFKRVYKAKDGMPGKTKDQYGQDAQDITLEMPVGTVIKETATGAVLARLDEPWQRILLAKGGKGGVGNKHFVNSQKQYSTIALQGEPWQKKEIHLELQLLADVALIGTPSVGKSSFINAVSNTKAKTADYPFTTLVPNLGVVGHKNTGFTIIDIPGLIKEAHLGKGLWNQFLRHIIKARIFAFMLDASRYETGIQEFADVFEEIRQYCSQQFTAPDDADIKFIHAVSTEDNLLFYTITQKTHDNEVVVLKKMITILINKYDLIADTEIMDEYVENVFTQLLTYFKKTFKATISKSVLRKQIVVVSTATRHNIDTALDLFLTGLEALTAHDTIVYSTLKTPEPESYVHEAPEEEFEQLLDEGYINETEKKYAKLRHVYEPHICYLTFVLPRWNDEAELRFRQIMEKEKHLKRLEKFGARKGDILRIISLYEGVADKYILRE